MPEHLRKLNTNVEVTYYSSADIDTTGTGIESIFNIPRKTPYLSLHLSTRVSELSHIFQLSPICKNHLNPFISSS